MEQAAPTRLPSRAAALLVVAAAFLAYVPVLDGEFLLVDDDRFIVDNRAIHDLDFALAVRCFTDPSTLGTNAWMGTYRPLRTLEFSIDWAISGGRPWFFHLRNVLYHALGALFCLILFRRLSPGREAAAVCGALVFAVHPVQTEAVAFVTSRADTMLVVAFLGALLLHVSGRRIAAAGVLVLALLSKEAAVVFPAAALIADHFRRAPIRLRNYAVYAALAAAYLVLWVYIQPPGLGHEGFGHNSEWWGGSYGASLLTTARALLYYAGLVVLPVRLVFDYFVTMTTGLDTGAALGILLVLIAVAGALKGGRHVRFAVLWFAVTLLPVLNILYSVGTPATERFLYLPMVGLAFLGGHLLARTRLAAIPLVCLFVLCVNRSRDWIDHPSLMASSRSAAVTQLGHIDLARIEFIAARQAKQRGDFEAMVRHGEAAIRAADELEDDFAKRVGVPPRGPILVARWHALDLLGRHEEALATAEREARQRQGRDFGGHVRAADSAEKLGWIEEAGGHIEDALRIIRERGGDDIPLSFRGAHLLNAAARSRAAAGQLPAARDLYSRSYRLLPDPNQNREAADFLFR